MAKSKQAQTLPKSVWPSNVIVPPPTAFAITQILAFFEDLGYDKTVKSLRKEAVSHGVDLESEEVKALRGPFKKSLGELYADALLHEDDSDEDSSASSDDEEELEADADSDSDGDSSSSDSGDDDDSADNDSEDSSESSPAESDTQTKAQPAALKRKREENSSASSSSDEESDSSSDEEAPPAKKSKVTAAKATSPAVSSDDSSSESDASSDSSSSEESSDSDSSSSDESDSSDGEEKKVDTSKARVARKSKTPESDSQASSETMVASPVKEENNNGDMHPARANMLNPSATKGSDKTKKSNVPFSRIPSNTYVDPRFSSNAYVSYDYADRAHQDLIVTKGKGFTKEKNKKKRGSYRGGQIDFTPKGIKFDD